MSAEAEAASPPPPVERDGKDAEESTTAEGEVDAGAEALINLSIVLPGDNTEKIQFMVSPQEQIHEVRQSIIDLPQAFQFTCFHLEHRGRKINDFVPLSEIPELAEDPEVHLVLDPYTEKEARIHLVRIRELIGAAGDRTETAQGTLPGLSLFETLSNGQQKEGEAADETTPVTDYDFQTIPSLTTLVPPEAEPAPKTIKSVTLSPWNPPPSHLRQRGHLLYLTVSTNEGEQHQITSHVSGFYVNNNSNAKFDPAPKPAAKGGFSHSLLDLIATISPSFKDSFTKLQEYNNLRDPLATFQITNAIPSSPWAVPSPQSSACTHLPDPTRSQETYLLSGVEATDTLRDWNEEFQSARELPKETVQDRVFRERLTSKLFADYNDAAAKGAVLVARGEVAPLNPVEETDAQIFVYNNIFFSFGADGVGTFTSEGGDEAARVATGKDVAGVRIVNQLDIDNLFTPATVVVDYLGKRVVGQSIVPGIFKQREPGDNQIDYGAVDGKDTVAADEAFVPGFSQLSKALKGKKHAVWDKDGKRFDLEASVETKGLLGTDGRKYVLDLYRITPLDIAWLEASENQEYPHRMSVLRPELIDAFARYKMKQFVDKELAEIKANEPEEEEEEKEDGKEKKEGEEEKKKETKQPDLTKFKFALNADAFSGQVPQTDEEKAEMEADEKDVREAATFLTETVIPDFLKDLSGQDASFPMDGQSLGRQLHKRGINMRYLGLVAQQCDTDRLSYLEDLCVQDMVARSFKHIAANYLRRLPLPLTAPCVAHLLNCLLGSDVAAKPVAQVDPAMRALYSDAELSFEAVTPESLREEIEEQTQTRFRYELIEGWVDTIRPTQLLREVSLRLGLQVQARDYAFDAEAAEAAKAAAPAPAAAQTNGNSKKNNKKKAAKDASPAVASAPFQTFTPDDIIDIVPLVKHSCPRSSLAEEALEAGRLSLMQNQKKLGQELLLESLSLHEQIYGVLHPEVARVYNQLSMMYYQMDDKEAAVELARKAIVVAERTVGVDSSETLLNYLNLSLFLHQAGDSRAALAYSKHALTLWKIIYGPDHPDSITTLNNAAVMLQHLKAYHESRLWFEESLRVCNGVYGEKSINSATLLFQLAQALALDHEPKNAVGKMREAYNIFLAELGAEDKNTKEAESWLEGLTQNAVNIAKQNKDSLASRIRAGVKAPSTGLVQPATAIAPGARQLGSNSQVDSRNIDELMKYIEGGEQQGKPSKKRQSRGNPKRRGGA